MARPEDKELIINNKAYRSAEQQVYKNMKDIAALQNIIKPEYKTTETLTSSSVSVAIADTNAPAGTTEGWIITEDGLKFKITGGDDTNLLLTFYADLKGPQGEDGAAVNIDDTGTSLTKVWSSKKTSDEIAGLIQDAGLPYLFKTWSSAKIAGYISSGIYYTTVEPTENAGIFEIEKSDIVIEGASNANLKVGDLIAYVDGDLKLSSLYKVNSISGSDVTMNKVCDAGGGGGTSYIHNIVIEYTDGSSKNVYFNAIVKSDSDTAFTYNTLATYLNTKGLTSEGKSAIASGFWYNIVQQSQLPAMGIYESSGNIYLKVAFNGTVASNQLPSAVTIKDTVI